MRSRASCSTSPLGYTTLPLGDVGDLRLLKRHVRLRDGSSVTVGVGESLAGVGARAGERGACVHPRRDRSRWSARCSPHYLIGTRVSRPLRRMAAVAARVDAGDLHPRIHDPEGEAREVRVLSDAFNHMLDRLDRGVRRASARSSPTPRTSCARR